MGRSRTLEVMFSPDDYDAELAERYGWINRALPADELGDFVRSLAHRIAAFPAAGRLVVKDRVNAIALAPADDFRRDSDLFARAVREPEAQGLLGAALRGGSTDPGGRAGPGLDAGRPGSGRRELNDPTHSVSDGATDTFRTAVPSAIRL